jgi:MFS family permease
MNSIASAAAKPGPRPLSRGGALAAVIGNVLEWYDFVLFGLFALPIAKAFFPAATELGSLLKSMAIFGVGFGARPVGAVVLGWYGDRFGRMPALVVAIVLMMAGTGLIAVTPGYAAIGLAAPILVVIARLVQGFSLGGEFSGATILLIEYASPRRRALYASFQMVGQFASTLAAVLIGALASRLLTGSQLYAWGWRVPFLIGLSIGPIAVYLRSRTSDSPEFVLRSDRIRHPLAELFRHHFKSVMLAFGLTASGTISTYAIIIYMPTYATRQLGMSLSDSFAATAFAALAGLLACPLAGLAADRYGHRRMCAWAAFIAAAAAYPLFALVIKFPSLTTLAFVQCVLAILLATYAAPAIAIGARLFPTGVRASGLSIGYSSATLALGGTAPFLVTWLTAISGNAMMAAYYVMLGAIVTLIASLFV